MASNQLPPLATLKADYYRLGSVRAVSRHHHVTDHRVRIALREAGVNVKTSGRPFLSEGHKCLTCANCTPIRCEFMDAEIGDIEAALKRMRARYKKVQHGYLVDKCPKWDKGDVGTSTVNANTPNLSRSER